ncbi:ATP-binding protein [Rhizobium sp. G21]|uniref:ATP-binding protein n=1 Tax=Rhizobium sp. G21 TaxID=2758439 RepID=UPI0015FFD240|nr:ATP-binding protein [Rhizobium sp. G21]MBB1247689.1 ATP-binding protein [Rhizobium sp. G21]
MGSNETHDLTPSPSAMLLSLRNVGYTLQTALADIVDNSISANASRIDIGFNWSGKQSFISVSDNGDGMSEDRLLEAMRLGRNPQDPRQLSDLGRFGLGLKMASWSQCRSFTVRSRLDDGSRATLRWDIDHMLATDRWEALSDPRPGSEQLLLADSHYSTGTVVLWEALDVLDQSGILSASHVFWEATERVEKHLAMTFQIAHSFQMGDRVQPMTEGMAADLNRTAVVLLEVPAVEHARLPPPSWPESQWS